MGPHSFECGNVVGPVFEPGPKDASMGPHSFECGNRPQCRARCRASQASMGPHSFECGNRAVRWPSVFRDWRFNGAALVRVRK